MASFRVLTAVAFVISLTITNLRAEDPQPDELRHSLDASVQSYSSATSSQSAYEVIQPCLGRGYVPYSYPAIGSCHCANNICFHPAKYYCGGKEYHKRWFHKWVKVHLGHGSMLENYPCHCVYPTVGRSYLRSVPEIGSSPNHATPPTPSPSALTEE